MPNFGSSYAIVFNTSDVDIKSFESYVSDLMDSLFYRTDDQIQEYFADSKGISQDEFLNNYDDYSEEYNAWVWDNFPGRYDKQWYFDRENIPDNCIGMRKVLVQNLTTEAWDIRNILIEDRSTFESGILVTAFSYFDIIRSKEWSKKLCELFHIVINGDYFSYDNLLCIGERDFDENTFVVFIYTMNF